jgi:predicted TIM-barrel fold metal-dependent hydrolase
MSRTYRYISGDTHLEVPTQRWTGRVPEKYRDRAPKTVRLPNGADGFLIEGLAIRENPMDLYGGKGRDSWRPFGQTYASTAGTGSPDDRLSCLDADGMDAEIMFPAVVTGPRAWRSIRDDAAYLAVVRAYNDFVAEEYAAHAPDRFFPVGVIPMTNVRDAIEEMGRCAKLGLKSVMLSAFPDGKGWPSPEDDAFWQESLSIRMPVTIHVDIDRSGPRDGPLVRFPRSGTPGQPPPDFARQVARFADRGAVNAVQLMLAGVFDRFPELRVFLAENQIGWVPLFMTVADERYDRHLTWAEELLGFEPLPNGRPSDYIRRHVLWGFQHDPSGVELRHWLGVDNLIWGSDFPHQESEFPHSLEVIERNFKGVPAEERHKMVCANAVEFFHLN